MIFARLFRSATTFASMESIACRSPFKSIRRILLDDLSGRRLCRRRLALRLSLFRHFLRSRCGPFNDRLIAAGVELARLCVYNFALLLVPDKIEVGLLELLQLRELFERPQAEVLHEFAR